MSAFSPIAMAVAMSASPVAAGSAEAFLSACSGADISVSAIAAELLKQDWRVVTPADELAYRALLDEGMFLMQAQRDLSPETLETTRLQMVKLSGQLDGGVTRGTLPGARLYNSDGSAALVVEDPSERQTSIQCYFAGVEDARFTTLLDQMREYHLLTYDHTYIERGPLDTTTNTTRTTSMISRFKPEASSLSLGKTAPLAI
ncbi:MAG: hypothetical protein ABI459_10230, partial [Deltaproteobacteria bacterium]